MNSSRPSRSGGPFGLWWFWYAVLGILALTVVGLFATVGYKQHLEFGFAEQRAAAYTPPPNDYTQTVVSPTVAFVGDSYTQGTGSSSATKTSWVARVSSYENWNAKNLGCGGSGYLEPGPYCKKGYQDRISEVVAANPSIVFVSGGRNDVSEPSADEAAAITKTFAGLREALPDIQIYAISPVWDNSTPPASLTRIKSQVEAAATKTGVTYLDIGEPLAGNADFITKDKVHPNDDGHAALASATEAALTKIGVNPIKIAD